MPHALMAKKKGYDIKVFCGNSVSLNSDKFAAQQLVINKINQIYDVSYAKVVDKRADLDQKMQEVLM
jgi:hypothetical protein